MGTFASRAPSCSSRSAELSRTYEPLRAKRPIAAPRKTGLREPSGYRKNVGICLVNADGLVFAARRCDDSMGTWQMPQGGIDRRESPAAAAIRELREETGITSARIVSKMDRWLTYDFPTAVRNRFTGNISRYRGQTQKWMLMYFYGDDGEIDLEAGGEREFLEHRWMRLEELPGRVVPFKAEVYGAVASEFGPLIRRQRQSQAMDDLRWG